MDPKYLLIALLIGVLVYIIHIVLLDLVDKQTQEKFDDKSDEYTKNMERLAERVTKIEELIPDPIDESDRQEDFIDVLTHVLEKEKEFAKNTISCHVKGLKDDFIKPLKQEIEKDEIDKEKLLKVMEYDFTHYQHAYKSLDDIESSIEWLKGHRSKNVIEGIRAKQTLEGNKK